MIQQAGEANMRYAFSKIRETLHKACKQIACNGSQVGEAVIVRSDAAGTIAVVFAVLLFACKAVFDKGTAVSS